MPAAAERCHSKFEPAQLKSSLLAAVVERIQARTYKVTSLALIRREDGQALSYFALDSRFESVRKGAADKVDARGIREMRLVA